MSLPSAVNASEKPVWLSGLALRSKLYTCVENGIIYTALKISGSAHHFHSDVASDGSSMIKLHGQTQSVRTYTLSHANTQWSAARDVQLIGTLNGQEILQRFRIFTINNKLYQFSQLAPKAHWSDAHAERFLLSIQAEPTSP